MFSSITNIKSNSTSSDFNFNFSSIYNLNNNGNELSSNQNLLGIPINSLPLIAKEYALNNEADIFIKNKDMSGIFNSDTINVPLLKEEPNNIKSNNFTFISKKLLTENNFDSNFLIKKRRNNSFNFFRNIYKFPNISSEELKRNYDDIYNIVKSFNYHDSIKILKKEYIDDNISNNFNFVKIIFKSNIYSIEFEREISLNLYFKELKENLSELIIENYKLYNNFDLMYENKFVNDNDKVHNISNRENVIIDIIFHLFKKEQNKLIIDNKVSQKIKKQTIENIKIKNREKVNKKELPILEKEGYLTIPTIPDLYNMSDDEIENVNNFTIYNNYGSILFPGKTNLKNLNLDEIIDISDRNVTVYKFSENKHKIGFGLNKEAIITLNNINFNENKEFYLKKIKLIGGRFVKFNDESFQLTFYKDNFEEE